MSSLCDRYEAIDAKPHRKADDVPEPVWTPAAREAAQEAILARWLALVPSQKNERLARERARVGFTPPDGTVLTRHVTHVTRPRGQTLTYQGRTLTILQWAHATGVSDETIYQRLRRQRPIAEVLGGRELWSATDARRRRTATGHFKKAG